MFWTRFPLLRLLLALCLGIGLNTYGDWPLSFILTGLGTAFSLWAFLRLFKAHIPRPAYGYLFGALALTVFMGLGTLAQGLMQERRAQGVHGAARWWVEIQEFPHPTENTIAASARLLGSWQGDSFKKRAGKVLLYLEPDSAARRLRYGDQLVFKGTIEPLPQALNPQQFDYGAYLADKGVMGTAYVASSRWTQGQRGGWPLWRSFMDLRLYLLEVIRGWPVSKVTREVAQALLLGYRAALADDLRQSFAQAGTMHVLAVSGLHVGIIYLVLQYLLFWLRRVPGGRWLQPLIIAVLLWGFAILAGFAPSVVRAVVMFTFVALGRCFDRYTSVYNALLASAIVLLLCHPAYLFQVGFQLSYAAVLAIVWVQPMLYRPLATKWAVLNFPLALLTVSIAAQLGTAPLALHYFGQFPGLFWLANLWVVPLVTLLMYGGFPLLGLSAVVALPEMLYQPYEWVMQWMIGGVAWIQDRDWGLIAQLDIGWGEVALLYILVVAGVWWLRRREKFLWYWGLALVALLSWQVLETAQQNRGIRVTAYHLDGRAGVGIYTGEKGYLLGQQSLLNDSNSIAYQLRPHWDYLDLRDCQQLSWALDTVWASEHLAIGPASLVVGEKLIWRKPAPPPAELAVDWWWVAEGKPPPGGKVDIKEVWLLSSQIDQKAWQRWARDQGVVLRSTAQGAINQWWQGTRAGPGALFASLWGGG